MVGASICRLDISKQNQQWNNRNNGIYSRDFSHYCRCSLETSKYKILEINVTNLFAVFYFYFFVYLSLWWIGQHWIEMDIFFLDSPLPYTTCNFW